MCLFACVFLYPVNFLNVDLCVGTCVSGFNPLDLLCRKRYDCHRCLAGMSFDYMPLSPANTLTQPIKRDILANYTLLDAFMGLSSHPNHPAWSLAVLNQLLWLYLQAGVN